MSIPVDAPKAYRDKLTQIIFEVFNPASFYMAEDAFLSCYGAGRTTGCVLDMGATSSRASIIYEESVLPYCTQTTVGSPVAGGT
jgi:actin-related protein